MKFLLEKGADVNFTLDVGVFDLEWKELGVRGVLPWLLPSGRVSDQGGSEAGCGVSFHGKIT